MRFAEKFAEQCYLTYLYSKVKKFEFFEQASVKKRYYRSSFFKTIDHALLSSYRWQNPYRISKKFLQNRGADTIHIYGETPLTTFKTIIDQCQINADDYFVDLGCGRGRGCFFIHSQVGCEVRGIEHIPVFASKAQAIVDRHRMKNISFTCQDIGQSHFASATVIYFYGIGLDPNIHKILQNKFRYLPINSQVITVGYALSSRHFTLKKRFPGNFPWGTTEIFANVKN